jgi:GNAT superfamily N-acetyltransferase
MIRKGDLADVGILDGIARRVAEELHASGVDQWSSTYPGAREFVADAVAGALHVDEIDGRIVGSISILPERDPAYDAVVWAGRRSLVVHRLMVDPSWRLRGVGTGLLAFAIATAKDAGADSLKVDTHPDNLRMRRLLESHGFIHRGHLPMINREAYELSTNL